MDGSVSKLDLQAVVDHAPEPIFIKDTELRYVYVNRALAAATGLRPEDFLGRTDAELLPPAVAAHFSAVDRDVLARREARTDEDEVEVAGGRRFYRTSKFPYLAPDGELLGVIAISRDITEQKRLENALVELAQGLSASTGQAFFTSIARYLAKALGVAYVLIDEVSRQDPREMRPVVLINEGEVIEGFAYPLAGTPCETVFGRQFHAYARDLAARFPDDPFLEPLALESYAGMPLFDAAGAPIGLVAVMHTAPMTNLGEAKMLLEVVAKRLEAELERKRADETVIRQAVALQQAQELARLKADFVNAVSHELRAPLTSITGYAEFLEDEVGGGLTPDQARFVRQIQHSAQRLGGLVDDLLDFARIDAGTFSLKRERADLAPKLREILASFVPQAAAAGVALTAELPDEPLPLEADAARVGQVLANLVSNALKFAEGRVAVRAIPSPEGLRVEVEDDGPGIAPADLPRLFQRFSQLEGGAAKGGTGLGLSISKALVEAHGGAIGTEPGREGGARFWFTLPA